MIAILLTRLKPYLWIAYCFAALVVVALVWHARGVWENSRKVDALNASIAEHAAAEAKSYGIGIDLETGLNNYRAQTLQYDRKVEDATSHDSAARFDAGSVQRTAERIAAGEAARKRGY